MTLRQFAVLGAAAAVTFAAGYCVGQRTAPAASDDKTLVVRDGSVEIFMDDLSDKANMTHTWSVAATAVDVLTGPPTDPCQTSQNNGGVAFDYVRFILVRGGTEGQLRAVNAADGRMALTFGDDDWEFRWNKTRRELMYQGSSAGLRLARIYVKPSGAAGETEYVVSGNDRLCARFVKQ